MNMHRLTFFFVNYVPFLNCEVELNVCIIENFMSLSYVLRYRDSIIKLYLFSYNAHDISIKDVYKASNIFLRLCTATKIKRHYSRVSRILSFLQDYIPLAEIVLLSFETFIDTYIRLNRTIESASRKSANETSVTMRLACCSCR